MNIAHSYTHSRLRQSGINGLAAVYLVSLMSLPRSFLGLKFALILLYLGHEFLLWIRGKKIVIYPTLWLFYSIVILVGTVWSLVGLLNGHPLQAILDYLRLYVLWSLAYLTLFTLLQNEEGRVTIHVAVVASGYFIFLINLIGFADFGLDLGWVSEDLRKELDMNIGFHEGYVQITSHNIGSLFFIIPYLYVLQLSKNALLGRSVVVKLSFIFVVLLGLLSGRRALWLCMLLVPLFEYFASKYWKPTGESYSKRILLAYMGLGVIALIFVIVAGGSDLDFGAIQHLMDAFSTEDERSIQLGYLLDGFSRNMTMGSGFGGYAGYVRSEKSPWLYELSYFQMLFNFGLIGCAALLATLGVFSFWAIKRIKTRGHFFELDKALLIAVFSFLIGVYSNPYLGSFDFLLYLGILPYLAVRKNLNQHGVVNEAR